MNGIELHPLSGPPNHRCYPRYGTRYHLIGTPTLTLHKNGSGTMQVKFTLPPSREEFDLLLEWEAGALRTMREVLTLER